MSPLLHLSTAFHTTTQNLPNGAIIETVDSILINNESFLVADSGRGNTVSKLELNQKIHKAFRKNKLIVKRM